MSAYYWNKLPHAYFDDRVIDTLRPELYKVYIKLTLLAGMENGADKTGLLPCYEDIVYKMRLWDSEMLETLMFELEEVGLLSRINGAWFVTDFATTQAAESAKKRKAEERKRKLSYVTKRDTEVEVEVEEKRREVEENVTTAAAALSSKDAGTFQERWTQRFMRDYFENTGEQAEEQAVSKAVEVVLDYIAEKDYPMKYNFDWIRERLERVSRQKRPVDIGPYLGS